MLTKNDIINQMGYGIDRTEFFINGFNVKFALGKSGMYTARIFDKCRFVASYIDSDLETIIKNINEGVGNARDRGFEAGLGNSGSVGRGFKEPGDSSRPADQEHAEPEQEAVGSTSEKDVISWR